VSILQAISKGILTYGPEETMAVGSALAKELVSNGDFRPVALYGSLGVGKTTFTRGFAAAVGYRDIVSPSFNYFLLYKGDVNLLHLDAYRLSSPEDYPSLMIDELLGPDMLFLIEWPENIGEYLPADVLKLRLGIENDSVHSIKEVHG